MRKAINVLFAVSLALNVMLTAYLLRAWRNERALSGRLDAALMQTQRAVEAAHNNHTKGTP